MSKQAECRPETRASHEVLRDEPKLTFAEIISALSFAVDLTEGAVPGHALRSCVFGMRMAVELGLSDDRLWPLYYALLMKDSGCSSNAARMCQIVGGDDRAVKNGVKLVDWTKPHRPSLRAVKLLWKQVLPRSGAMERIGRMLQIVVAQNENNEEMIALRCERGAGIARKLGLTSETAEAIRGLDEHWDGSGYPERRRGEEIPLAARILGVAQHLDVFASERSQGEAMAVLRARSGTWFDPRLVDVAVRLDRAGVLWENCRPGDDPSVTRELVVAMQPKGRHAESGAGPGIGLGTGLGIGPGALPEEIDRICEAFADVVDAKSPFTYRHSLGVAEVAAEIAEALQLAPERSVLVRRAALLHDLGKLAVPNTILDKTGKLTEAEWAVVREHPRLSREILERIGPFAEMAEIAGAHHERLDGSGYPHGLKGSQLSMEARVIAVADYYSALTEDRPYRRGMTHAEAMIILRKERAGLCGACVEALEQARGRGKLRAGMAPELTARMTPSSASGMMPAAMAG